MRGKCTEQLRFEAVHAPGFFCILLMVVPHEVQSTVHHEHSKFVRQGMFFCFCLSGSLRQAACPAAAASLTGSEEG